MIEQQSLNLYDSASSFSESSLEVLDDSASTDPQKVLLEATNNYVLNMGAFAETNLYNNISGSVYAQPERH